MSEHPRPPRGDVLFNFEKLAEGKFKKIGEERDVYGRYAIKYETLTEKLPFYVVGRGSEYTDVASVTKELLDKWKGPLVLAWYTDDEGWRFYLLSADLIDSNEHWVNQRPDRPDVDMVNFSILIAEPFSPIGDVHNPSGETVASMLAVAWARIKQKTEAKKKGKISSDVYY